MAHDIFTKEFGLSVGGDYYFKSMNGVHRGSLESLGGEVHRSLQLGEGL